MKAREAANILGCARLPAWFGADVIKAECPGVEYAPGTKNQTVYK
jgi:hypothetical protein